MHTSTHPVLALALSTCLTLGLAACGEDAEPDEKTVIPEDQILRSSKTRLSPTTDTALIEAQVDGNTAFTLDMYTILSKGDDNLIFSPHSISIALAMTYAGANGNTADEMASALHFTGPEDTHAAFNALDQHLASHGQGCSDCEYPPPLSRLTVENSLWAQDGLPIRSDYLDTLGLYYGAPVYLMDFANDHESARRTINGWVNDNTEDRIPELLGQGTIKPATRLVLTNAIYFKADWNSPFEKEDTSKDSFTTLSGSTSTVDMMSQEQHVPYTQGDGYKALELLYAGYNMSMVFILPTEGTFRDFQSQLSPELLQDITSNLQETPVRIHIPKFDFESKSALKEAFQTLGMNNIFDSSADLTGMFDPSQTNENLYVDAVIHQANITLDEKGTEAAASTAVTVYPASAAPQNPTLFRADRPFFFMIRDIQTNSIIFFGHVTDPS